MNEIPSMGANRFSEKSTDKVTDDYLRVLGKTKSAAKNWQLRGAATAAYEKERTVVKAATPNTVR